MYEIITQNLLQENFSECVLEILDKTHMVLVYSFSYEHSYKKISGSNVAMHISLYKVPIEEFKKKIIEALLRYGYFAKILNLSLSFDWHQFWKSFSDLIDLLKCRKKSIFL